MAEPLQLPIEQLRFNADGLIPAIAQDWLDGAVLMVAWMNRQALELTLTTREVHYWSRSRQELWHKGATSGHFQDLKAQEILLFFQDSKILFFLYLFHQNLFLII